MYCLVKKYFKSTQNDILWVVQFRPYSKLERVHEFSQVCGQRLEWWKFKVTHTENRSWWNLNRISNSEKPFKTARILESKRDKSCKYDFSCSKFREADKRKMTDMQEQKYATCKYQKTYKPKARFPLGEFVRANTKFSYVIGWRKSERFR